LDRTGNPNSASANGDKIAGIFYPPEIHAYKAYTKSPPDATREGCCTDVRTEIIAAWTSKATANRAGIDTLPRAAAPGQYG
jgi:hypothetical protein